MFTFTIKNVASKLKSVYENICNQSQHSFFKSSLYTSNKANRPVLSCQRWVIIVDLDPFINTDMQGDPERCHQFPIPIQKCWLAAWIFFFTAKTTSFDRQTLHSVFCWVLSFKHCLLTIESVTHWLIISLNRQACLQWSVS